MQNLLRLKFEGKLINLRRVELQVLLKSAGLFIGDRLLN